jgi:hypothetical protein
VRHTRLHATSDLCAPAVGVVGGQWGVGPEEHLVPITLTRLRTRRLRRAGQLLVLRFGAGPIVRWGWRLFGLQSGWDEWVAALEHEPGQRWQAQGDLFRVSACPRR